MIKEIINSLWLKSVLREKMCELKEMQEVSDAADTYSKYICRMNNWPIHAGGGYTDYFCDTSFAFMAGYIKSMRDNGFKFDKGMVKPIDPECDMPCGGKVHYDSDMRKKNIEEAIGAFSNVLSRYEPSKQNIATIINEFKKEIDLK